MYDRQEVIEMVKHLARNRTLSSFSDMKLQSTKELFIEALSEEEEKNVFWAVRKEKHWYQLT